MHELTQSWYGSGLPVTTVPTGFVTLYFELVCSMNPTILATKPQAHEACVLTFPYPRCVSELSCSTGNHDYSIWPPTLVAILKVTMSFETTRLHIQIALKIIKSQTPFYLAVGFVGTVLYNARFFWPHPLRLHSIFYVFSLLLVLRPPPFSFSNLSVSVQQTSIGFHFSMRVFK